MAVSLRGYTQGAFSATGQHSIAWPAGTAVADKAYLLCATGKDKKPATRVPSGWSQEAVKSDGTSLWSKLLTAADLASPVTVTARIAMLTVLTGAGMFYRSAGSGESMKINNAGGGMLLCGWKKTTDTLTVSAKIHAEDVVNASYDNRRYNLWWAPMPTPGTAYIDTNASYFIAEELAPWDQPFSPTVLSPDDGVFVDHGSELPVRMRHNSTGTGLPSIASVQIEDTTSVNKWSVKIDGSGNWTLLLNVIGDWFPVPGNVIVTAKIATSLLSNNNSYRWYTRTGEPGTSTSPNSVPSRVFHLRSKPTVAASVSGTGFTRTAGWTPTITNGSQTWYRVRVCPAADTNPDVPLWDSGIIAGADTSLAIPPTIGWANGASYKAWVEIGQTGGQQTVPTASSSFTVSWTPPTAPTVTAQTSARPMTLTVSGLAGRDLVQVQRQVGAEWVEVLTTAVTGASMVLPMPLAPYGAGQWRVLASSLVSGVQLWSAPTSIAATCDDTASYLVTLDGSGYRRARWYRVGKREDTEGVATSYPLGADEAVVLRTPSQGAASSDPALICETQAEVADLKAFLRANPALWVRWSPERDGTTYADVPALKVARTSALDEDRPIDKPIQIRTVPFAWVQQQ